MFQIIRSLPIRIGLLSALLGASVLFVRAAPLFAAGVVGNGTPGSCTEAAFDTALSGGGNIKFKCGTSIKTITLTNTKTIAVTTSIDGGNKIVLSAPGHSHFLVNSSVTLDLKNITIKNGSGTNAGALENYGTVNLDTVKFLNNAASVHGGAITNHGTLVAVASQFKANNAGTAGGAIYNDGGAAQIYLVRFLNNQATSPYSTGGAIDNNAGAVLILAGTFKNNHALDGGAIYNTGDGSSSQELIAVLSNFSSNTAGYGGAIENNGGAQVEATTLSKNTATGDGGAIWNLNGSLDLTDSALDQNSAGTTGGGVSLYDTTGDIERVSFTNNHAGDQGGGVYNTGDMQLYNNTFSGNSSNSAGGGVYTSYGSLTAYNNTISDNTAPAGGGFEGGGGTLDVQNNVLAHNTGGDCGGTVTSNGANASSDTSCTGFTKPGDQPHINPFLSPPAKNGGLGLTYLPEFASTLIDGGVTLSDIDVDERSVTRPQMSGPDIGAIEVCQVSPTAPPNGYPSNNSIVNPGPFAFQWTAPDRCGAFYQLTVRSGSKTGPVVIQQSYVPIQLYFQKKALPPEVTYYWQVKACDEVGCTPSKWWHFKVSSKALATDEQNLPDVSAQILKLLGHK